MLWSVPWLTSGWYGVYEVANSGRPITSPTTDGMRCRYAPAPRKLTSGIRLRPARRASSARTSCSARGGGTSHAPARTAAGMSANRSSTDSTPTASSISARSASV